MTNGRQPPISRNERAVRVAMLQTPEIPIQSQPGQPHDILSLHEDKRERAIAIVRDVRYGVSPNDIQLLTHVQDDQLVLSSLQRRAGWVRTFRWSSGSPRSAGCWPTGFTRMMIGGCLDDR